MERQHVRALKRAIAIAGTQAELAKRMRAAGAKKASQQLISGWLNSGALISDRWWVALETATSGVVTRRDLRPDLFAAEHAA